MTQTAHEYLIGEGKQHAKWNWSGASLLAPFSLNQSHPNATKCIQIQEIER